MIDSLRFATRLFLFGVWSLACFLFVLVTAPVVRLARGTSSRWRARVMRRWSRGTAVLIGMTVTVEGDPPRAPFLLVSNHLSYVDILLLSSQVPCTFVAKAEVSDWPFFGRLARAANTVFISRENKRDIPDVLAQIEREFRSGVGVVVFPEGTNSRGAEILPFRAPLLEAAARGGIPVAYAALSYATAPGAPAARDHVCWGPDLTFIRHFLQLFRLRAFDARIVFGPDRITDPDRKALAARLHAAVSARFTPVR